MLKSRQEIDRLRLIYLVLVVVQLVTIALYEMGSLPKEGALVSGLITSLIGPMLSFMVSIHVFRHRRHSKAMDIASVALTYAITCISFAIIYVIVGAHNRASFNVPPGSANPLDFGTAVYFSIVTITTTGFGDISPASGLARIATCWEIMTGLLYQVFIFSLAASLLTAPEVPRSDRPGADRL